MCGHVLGEERRLIYSDYYCDLQRRTLGTFGGPSENVNLSADVRGLNREFMVPSSFLHLARRVDRRYDGRARYEREVSELSADENGAISTPFSPSLPLSFFLVFVRRHTLHNAPWEENDVSPADVCRDTARCDDNSTIITLH